MTETLSLVEHSPENPSSTALDEAMTNAVAEALSEPAPEPLPVFADMIEDPIEDEAPVPDSVPERAPRQVMQMTTAAVISFSLTLLVASGIVLFGYLPLDRMAFAQRVDLGAVLLFAPVCALVLALLFEVAIVALKAPIEAPEPRRLPIDWAAGRREG